MGKNHPIATSLSRVGDGYLKRIIPYPALSDYPLSVTNISEVISKSLNTLLTAAPAIPTAGHLCCVLGSDAKADPRITESPLCPTLAGFAHPDSHGITIDFWRG